jgi:hypothetical protein
MANGNQKFVALTDQISDHLVNHAATSPARNYKEWVQFIQQNASANARITTSIVRTAKRDAEVRLHGQGQTLTEPNRANGFRFGVTDDQLAYWLEARGDLGRLFTWLSRLIANGAACNISNSTISQATNDVDIAMSEMGSKKRVGLAALMASESEDSD